MKKYTSNAKGLKICGTFLSIALIGISLLAAIRLFYVAGNQLISETDYAKNLRLIGLGAIIVGPIISLVSYYLFSCIADLTQSSYSKEEGDINTTVEINETQKTDSKKQSLFDSFSGRQ